jgi:beta-lactamase class A
LSSQLNNEEIMMMSLLFRWAFLVMVCLLPLTLVANTPSIDGTQQSRTDSIQEKLAQLETSLGARIGVSALNTAYNTRIQYRADELFPFCSTGKIMTAAAILQRSEHDPAVLQKHISYDQADVDKSGYAIITKQHVVGGMSIAELCQAMLDYSDNTAMNLLTEFLGGPAAITAYARSIQDNTFRLDRMEPDLNSAIPGDMRDTTTPAAMGKSLQRLTMGDALAPPQREQLVTWLKNNTTGDLKIRAGVPKDWVVGDKTGSGAYGTTNDIGVIWPPKCQPIVLVIYLTHDKKDAKKPDETIATITQMVINEFASTDQCIKKLLD